MKKLFLTLALVLGVSIANAQFFIGGQFGITHDDAKDNTTFISLRMPVGLFLRETF